MKKYLVTGGSGFIGSRFVHHILGKYNDVSLINVDKLTYAGNQENLKDVSDDEKAREEMVDKSQQLGVPVIEIGEEIVVGFNKDKLVELLGL